VPNSIATALKTVLLPLARRPLRLVLQLITVVVGTGALALALGVSSRLDGFVAKLDSGGRRIAIANASLSSSDTGTSGQAGIEWQNPPIFTAEDAPALKSASQAIREVSIVNNIPWDRIQSGGKAWRVRRVLASDERHAEVMGLRVVAGSFFGGADVAEGNRVVAISEAAAKSLYGGSAEALGKTIGADRGIRNNRNVVIRVAAAQAARSGAAAGGGAAGGGAANAIAARRGSGFASAALQSAIETFTVVAVYADATDLERSAYGIPDMIVPWTAARQRGRADNAAVRTLVARADAASLEKIGADLRVDVARRHGTEAKVMVWEGDPARPQSDLLGRARNALSDFSALAQALGGLILAIACFGIASGIAVEAADRSRETAIRRALGLTVLRSAVGFCVDGILTALAGGLLGLGLAALFYDPVALALDPYLSSLGVDLGSLGGGLPLRALLAPLGGVLAAFLFSLAPAYRSASGPIADGLKE